MKQKKTKGYGGFILVVSISLLATIYLSYHTVNVLFGDNSLQVYSDLKHKKEWLESEILRYLSIKSSIAGSNPRYTNHLLNNFFKYSIIILISSANLEFFII